MVTRAAGLLVQGLQDHGIDRVFAVPGESYLSVLDALVDVPQVQVITCRHESGAGFMALADAGLRAASAWPSSAAGRAR